MKKLMTAAVMGLALMGTSLSADPIYGNWRTIKDDNGNSGLIKISACGSKICGTLIKSYDANGKAFESENNGRKLIWDMTNDGGGNYSGGKVFSPDRGKTYNGRLALSGNSLNVKGCVLGVCRSGGKWSRVN